MMVPDLPDGLQLIKRQNVFGTKCFRAGLFEVQDGASQMVAPFLQVEPGMRVIDACAGAGGKTLHLACLMKNKGLIQALDVLPWKLDELRKRFRRNEITCIAARGHRMPQPYRASKARPTACCWTCLAQAWACCAATRTPSGSSARRKSSACTRSKPRS